METPHVRLRNLLQLLRTRRELHHQRSPRLRAVRRLLALPL